MDELAVAGVWEAAMEIGCSSTQTGGEKAGTACFTQTGGATRTGGGTCRSCGARPGGGSGGAENTGIAFLIVTGGAIPWWALKCRMGM